MRIGVLASGTGSNLQAILDGCASRSIPAEVAVVICNIPGAKALQRAEAARVPAVLLPHQKFPNRDEFDRDQHRTLVKQLKDGVLRVGAGSAPGHRSRRVSHRFVLGGHRLTVRFHLQLLEVEWQQPQPLIISE